MPTTELEAPEPDEEGRIVAALLRGKPEPQHGILQDARGTAPAIGPTGIPGSALSVDGEGGIVRYLLPWFPEEDYTVALRVLPRSTPRPQRR